MFSVAELDFIEGIDYSVISILWTLCQIHDSFVCSLVSSLAQTLTFTCQGACLAVTQFWITSQRIKSSTEPLASSSVTLVDPTCVAGKILLYCRIALYSVDYVAGYYTTKFTPLAIFGTWEVFIALNHQTLSRTQLEMNWVSCWSALFLNWYCTECWNFALL